jgi:calnexin
MLTLLLAHSASAGRSKYHRDSTGVPYLPDCKIIYYDNFSDPHVFNRWKPSNATGYNGTWKCETLFQLHGRRGEKGISLDTKGKTHAISHRFRHPISVPENATLIIQYEARGQFLFTCTTAYIKIFTDPTFDPANLTNDTIPFLEFGPERCGLFNQSRLNVFRTASDGSPVNHSLKNPHWIPIDEVTHLYTLIIRPDGTFETLIDNRSSRNGTWIDDFTPPIFEMPTIDDPSDVKPEDWDDRVLVRDPNARKPADWDDDAPFQIPDPRKRSPPPGWLVDEPKMIPDASTKKPANWNEDTMGEWKPRNVPNPKCYKAAGCGEYKAPTVRNPKAHGKWRPHWVPNALYKGEWKPRQIPNPNYKGEEPKFVIPPIVAIGFSVWTEHRDFAFTNILLATDEREVKKWNGLDFAVRQRRQVRMMRISYDWLRVDLPDDVPEPGIRGRLEYYGRAASGRWGAVKNKPLVFGVIIAVLAIVIPVTILCCYLCEPDPFAHLKTD